MNYINFVLVDVSHAARINYKKINWLWPRTEIIMFIINVTREVFTVNMFDAYTLKSIYPIEASTCHLYGVKLKRQPVPFVETTDFTGVYDVDYTCMYDLLF